MQLPSDFASLTVPQQLLVVTNLERIDRGLTPVSGLAADLDAAAAQAAAADNDPMLNKFSGDALASNWMGGIGSPLFADFVWMYDDGPGSDNAACPSAGASGCWGHRHNILYRFDSPIAMGAGYDATSAYGPSLTELFIGGDTATSPGQADALLSPTWSALAQPLAGSSSTITPIAQTAGVEAASPASPTPTNFRIRLGRKRIRRGAKVAVTGRLRAAKGAVVGQLVTLFAHAPGSSALRAVARRRTRSGGRVRFHVRPGASTIYSLAFAGTTGLTAVSTRSVEVRVTRLARH